MEERTCTIKRKFIFFEKSNQTISINIVWENIEKDDMKKTKDFLETMFEEIIKEII